MEIGEPLAARAGGGSVNHVPEAGYVTSALRNLHGNGIAGASDLIVIVEVNQFRFVQISFGFA